MALLDEDSNEMLMPSPMDDEKRQFGDKHRSFCEKEASTAQKRKVSLLNFNVECVDKDSEVLLSRN